MRSSYRLDQIYTLILNRSKISVEELADIFHVTPTTIRRDLIDMEAQGLVRRTRGYAVACEDTARIASLDIFREEKRRIAEAAKAFVSNGMSLALDSGSTVQAVSELLVESPDINELDIVTNSLLIALKMCRKFRLSMPGGSVLSGNAALVGVAVDDFFKSINVDLAFLGTTGIYGCNGLTVSYPLHMSVKKNIVACANKRIAVLDSSKFIGRGIFTFCEFSQLDVMITVKTSENEAQLREIEKQGVQLVLV
ncbi:MAG TPA: DeoR/GlpR family DNA-binding transcription regulator [Clostridia bacterium]|nr:DeoR/GlpR family DNA-binding transcription regulator [Clostridia bacterium]